MLLSYEWLAEYVDISDRTPAELAELYTEHVAEVDAVLEPGGGWPSVGST